MCRFPWVVMKTSGLQKNKTASTPEENKCEHGTVTGDGKLGDVEVGIGFLPSFSLYLAFHSRFCSPSLFTLHLHYQVY